MDETREDDHDPPVVEPVRPHQTGWRRTIITGRVLLALVSLTAAIGRTRDLELLCGLWMTGASLRAAMNTLPPDTRLRRALLRPFLYRSPPHPWREPTPDERPHRDTLRRGSFAFAAASVVPLALLYITPWALTAYVLLSVWFLVLSARLPVLRADAGLSDLTTEGSVPRVIADSLELPPPAYSNMGRNRIAPVTLIVIAASFLGGASSFAAGVAGHRGELGGLITLHLSSLGKQSDPGGSSGANRDGGDGLPTPTPTPTERPACADDSQVTEDMHAGLVPTAVGDALDRAWKRINWPTLGCISGRPYPDGLSWVAVLDGGKDGHSLIVYVHSHAVVVFSPFDGQVLGDLPQLTDLSAVMGFGAGQLQFETTSAGNCPMIMTARSDDRSVLVPQPVTEAATRLGEALHAFMWISQPTADGSHYLTTALTPVTEYPGYVKGATVSIDFDPEVQTASARTLRPGHAPMSCRELEDSIKRLANPIAVSATNALTRRTKGR